VPARLCLGLAVAAVFVALFGVRRENMALAPHRAGAADEAVRAVADLPALALRHPFFEAPAGRVREAMAALAPAHREYTGTVSAAEHAASLELSGFTRAFVGALGPRAVMDTGSGFTSHVLRGWAAERGGAVRVVSADDDATWLERTRASLAAKGLSTEGLGLWKDVGAPAPPASFDLVLHDLGSMATRLETLPTVLALVRPGGWLVLDDMHKPEFRAAALAYLASRGLLAYSLRALTGDALGRYAYAVPVPVG
jgi:hypothetical protein